MSNQNKDSVRGYYSAFGEREWQRLANTPSGAIEWAITCRTLETYLPKTGLILDIGGGPGRYSLWLAERGYQVVLADLSPELLEIARTKSIEAGLHIKEIKEADACNLSAWPDASFDAIVCLGPFYHLPDPIDRDRAASELTRVLRPAGVAFIAFMPRYGFLRRTIARSNERHRLLDPVWVKRLLEEGVFENDVPGKFTSGYGADPMKIVPFLERFKLAPLALLAAEGFSGGIEREMIDMAQTEPALYKAALELVIQTVQDPTILGMADHLLYVGRKKP